MGKTAWFIFPNIQGITATRIETTPSWTKRPDGVVSMRVVVGKRPGAAIATALFRSQPGFEKNQPAKRFRA
ncbi:MAG: hypothetical protein H7Z75_19545 [Ferruginibacter sp.]|nr:hypothetical protein [Cytophagales bacterium]